MIEYLKGLTNEEDITTVDDFKIKLYTLKLPVDDAVLNNWAKHFRNNYISDDELSMMIRDTKMTQDEFLLKMKFPDNSSIGKTVKSGDFSELLISDFLEFISNYYVPRVRYKFKDTPNSSAKGTDIIGIKDINSKKSDDELLICEVKALTSDAYPKDIVSEAIIHSNKDMVRYSITLATLKHRLTMINDASSADRIGRFMDKVNNPYTLKRMSAAVYSEKAFKKSLIEEINVSKIDLATFRTNEIMVIKSNQLFNFIIDHYRRAANV